MATLDLPDDLLAADSVAIHFVAGEGLSFYPDYHLLEELFSNPALISRPRYRETLSGFLHDPDTSPEPLRRLAARDPAKASTVFAKLSSASAASPGTPTAKSCCAGASPATSTGRRFPEPSRSPKLLSDALQRSR